MSMSDGARIAGASNELVVGTVGMDERVVPLGTIGSGGTMDASMIVAGRLICSGWSAVAAADVRGKLFLSPWVWAGRPGAVARSAPWGTGRI